MAMGGATSSRQRRRGRRGVMAEINVTPVVDVMLVLLIVFMVAAPLLVTGVPVELPKTSAGAIREEAEPLSVTVGADGAVYLQDEAILIGDLAPKLHAIARENPETRIYVRADGKADYENVAVVMAALQTAGLTRIALLTEPVRK
jgi:biopolymer transport protein TolR